VKVALAQLNSNDVVSDNIQVVIRLTKEASANGADVIFFPENSLFFRLNQNDNIHYLDLKDQCVHQLENLSNELQIAIHLTTPIRDQKAQRFNASLLFRPGASVEVLYRKIHLFDIELKNQKPICESESFDYGADSSVWIYQGFRFGSSICYDVRFAELYSQYARQEVDVIVIPAAFLVKTGAAHWDILLRARAVESQCYVLAAAQWGRHANVLHNNSRETYGNTLAIGPWGEVLARKESGVGLIYVELSHANIESVRTQIPMKNHRRL